MKKYRVDSDTDASNEFDTFEEAEIQFELWKDYKISDSVTANESYVEIVVSEDDFENEKVLKKVVAVIDHDRTELGTPQEEGFDWDYWAKWQEVNEEVG